MKTHRPELPLEVVPADVEMVYRALLRYAEDLDCLLYWVDNEEAKANIRKEWAEYKQLSLAIYESHMQKALCQKPITRPNSASTKTKRQVTPVNQWKELEEPI